MTAKKRRDKRSEKKRNVYRSAETGRFVSESYAKNHRKTVIAEQIDISSPSNRATGVPPKVPKPPKPGAPIRPSIVKK